MGILVLNHFHRLNKQDEGNIINLQLPSTTKNESNYLLPCNFKTCWPNITTVIKKTIGRTSIFSVRLFSLISVSPLLMKRLHRVPVMLSSDGWGFLENVDICGEDTDWSDVCVQERECEHIRTQWQRRRTWVTMLAFSPSWDCSAENDGSLMNSPSFSEPSTTLLRSAVL